MGLIATLSILMVSTIRYTSMKVAGSGRQAFFLVLLIAGIGMAVWFYSQYALLAIAAIYVSHGLLWWVIRSIGRIARPSATNG